ITTPKRNTSSVTLPLKIIHSSNNKKYIEPSFLHKHLFPFAIRENRLTPHTKIRVSETVDPGFFVKILHSSSHFPIA
ncbi:MAG: hypothetical protein IKT73_10000, partial [Anaerotignum sp.]|nr:hypothetical protein [Anaerotignum sp.]